MFVDLAVLIIFPGAMALAAATDLFTMTIPNKISIFLVAAFFVLAPFSGFSLEDIAMHVVAGLAMLALCIAFFAKGWIGGGDAKIFAAASLWFGFEHLMEYAMLAALAGGALTLGLLFVRRFPLPAFLARQDWLARLHDVKSGIPYGIALGAAALIVYPTTPWMQ